LLQTWYLSFRNNNNIKFQNVNININKIEHQINFIDILIVEIKNVVIVLLPHNPLDGISLKIQKNSIQSS